MSREWDYAELSKMAKEHGGPEQLLADYGEEKINEGIAIGEKQGAVKGIAVTLIVEGAFIGFLKLKNFVDKKKADKRADRKKRLNDIEHELINGINEFDKEQECDFAEADDCE